MPPADIPSGEPEDPNVRYDLAGNPLPPLPKADRPAPSPGLPHAPSPPAGLAASRPTGYRSPPVSATASVPAARTTPSPLLYLGIGAGLLLGLILGVRALKPKPVVAPVAFKTYSAIDGSFTCDQPFSWTMHETGATGGSESTVAFDDGNVRVRVISDATGSLMSDAMGTSNPNLPPEQQVPPVQKLHDLDQKQLSSTMTDYKEQDAQKFQSGAGDARVSEWTASGGAGTGSLHGYRVTMLGREREFTVICFCPESDWALLMPSFQRIIGSVKPGNPS